MTQTLASVAQLATSAGLKALRSLAFAALLFLDVPLTVLAHPCSKYYILYMTAFGNHIRTRREALRQQDKRFSMRQVAQRIGVEPAYLSKIERGDMPPPSEATTLRLAAELDEDPDVLLALAGKVSSDLQEIIRKRPRLFADLIRELKSAPDHAILRLVREVRDGDW